VYYVGYKGDQSTPAVIATETKTKGWFNDLRFLVGVSRTTGPSEEFRITSVAVTNTDAIHGREEWLLKNESFIRQFAGKRVGDAFRIGKDIDAVTGATSSSKGSALAIKLKARKLVRAFRHEQLLSAARKSEKRPLARSKE